MSNLPDLNELGEMARSFLNDVSQSVKRIYGEYKEKHVEAKAETTVDVPEEIEKAPGQEDSEAHVTHEETEK